MYLRTECLQLYDPAGDPGGTLRLLCLTLTVCCNDHMSNSDLHACGQPHAASLQAVGPVVSGFAVWAATRGFIASCRSGCPGCHGGVWAATRGFLASCRSECSMTRLVGHGRPRIESCLSEWNNVKLRCFWCSHGAASAVVRPLRVNSPGRVPAPSPLSPSHIQ